MNAKKHSAEERAVMGAPVPVAKRLGDCTAEDLRHGAEVMRALGQVHMASADLVGKVADAADQLGPKGDDLLGAYRGLYESLQRLNRVLPGDAEGI